jgi:8-amino-7-oxononanoate synthase
MWSRPSAYQDGEAAIFCLFALVLPDIRRFHATAMRSLDEFACGKLAALERARLRRTPVVTARDGIFAERGGRRLLSFSCNDYLNLSRHPAIIKAAVDAAQRFGIGAGASRLVTGNHPLYDELESLLARLKGSEAACVFGSGYLANIGIIPALAGRGDLILVDELSHACIHAGAKLSGATVQRYRHGDVAHAEALLAEHRARHAHALIATDGVFSMDGDLAPLEDLSALAKRYDAWLLADDAHGLGVVGHGRGSSFANGGAEVPLQMGTLSKAVGAYGGYLCASAAVIDLMRTRARPFIYSTGLPPPVVAAAIAALDLIERDRALTEEPLRKARLFTRALNLPEAQSAIVPVIVGEAEAALAASEMLEAEGFLVVAIRPPTVPPGTARLRFAFTAQHPEAEIERLAGIVRTRVIGRHS